MAKGGRRRNDVRTKTTRGKILAAARALLTEKGPPGLTLSAIAKTIGMRVSSLYTHFQNLDAICAAVAEQTIGEFYEALRKMLAETKDEPFDKALQRLIHGIVTEVARAPKLHHGVLTLLSAEQRRDIHHSHLRLHVDQLEGFFAKHERSITPDPRTAAFVLVHAANGIGQAIAREAAKDPGAIKLYLDELVNLAVRYLEPKN